MYLFPSALILSTNGFKIGNSSVIQSYDGAPKPEYLYLIIRPVSSFSHLYSDTIHIQDMEWEVLATKKKENNADYLGVYLYANIGEKDTKSWEVNCTFQLISRGKAQPDPLGFTEIKFDSKNDNYGFKKFIKWEELTKEDNKHVVHDTTILETEIIIVKK